MSTLALEVQPHSADPPSGDATRSRIWLRVREEQRLEQLVRQMEKLADVLEVRRHDADHEVFLHLEEFFGNP